MTHLYGAFTNTWRAVVCWLLLWLRMCIQDDEEQDVVMTSMSFHQQGEVCVTARNDGVISVINCLSGMCVCTTSTCCMTTLVCSSRREGLTKEMHDAIAVCLNRITKTILTKRYGVDLVRFTHHPDCILFSSMNDANDCTPFHTLAHYIFRAVLSDCTACASRILLFVHCDRSHPIPLAF